MILRVCNGGCDSDFDNCSEDEIECIETNEEIQTQSLNIEKQFMCGKN